MRQKQPLSILILCTLLFVLSACDATTGRAPWETGSKEQTTATQPPQAAGTQATSLESVPPGLDQQISAPKEVTKVAILLPLTGKHSAMGQAMLQAAQLALFDLNESDFELMPRDTGGTAQGAAQAATSAINDGARLILGPLFADAVRSAKSVAAQRNVNVIAFSTDWTLGGGNTFLMGFMPFSQVERISSFAASQNIRNVGLIAPRDQYGEIASSSFDQAAQKNGITISQRFRFNPAERNLTPLLKDFTQFEQREMDPTAPLPWQAVFIPVGGQQADAIAGSLSYYGATHNKVKKLGTGLWDDPRVANLPHMQGAWFAAPSPKSRQTFERKYSSTYGAAPPRLASLAYDAAALAIVLNRMGMTSKGQPAYDTASILNPNGFAGVDGIFRFGRNGIVQRGLAVLEIRQRRVIEVDPAPRTFQNLGY